MNERDTLAEIFFEIDQTIAWYLKSNEIVERECGYSNGHIKSRDKLAEYETRRRKIRRDYEEKCYNLIARLNHTTAKFPADKNLSVKK